MHASLEQYLRYWPGFVAAPVAQQWQQALQQTLAWQQPSIQLYGRTVAVPRLTAWVGDADAVYQYSGILHQPMPWTPLLLEIKKQVETQVGDQFNSVLLNLYRHGADSNGWHADDEPELNPQHGIASLSLGAERRFRLRSKDQPRESLGHMDLASGSLLYMRPGAQQVMQHCLAKTRREVGPRINLTFRQVGEVKFC